MNNNYSLSKKSIWKELNTKRTTFAYQPFRRRVISAMLIKPVTEHRLDHLDHSPLGRLEFK